MIESYYVDRINNSYGANNRIVFDVNDTIYDLINNHRCIMTNGEPDFLCYYKLFGRVSKLLQEGGKWESDTENKADLISITIGLSKVKDKLQISHLPELYKVAFLDKITNFILKTNHSSILKEGINLYIKNVLPVAQVNESEFNNLPLDVINHIGYFYYHLSVLKKEIS